MRLVVPPVVTSMTAASSPGLASCGGVLTTKRGEQVEVTVCEAGGGEGWTQLGVDEHGEAGDPGDHQHRRRVEVRPDLPPPRDDRFNPVLPVRWIDRLVGRRVTRRWP
jgi:hypothetical protein